MRLTPVRNRRAAFTLVELLIVMGIIAVLASISIGAVFSLRESQIKNATETTVQKLASAFDQQLKAQMDQIFDETPSPVAQAFGRWRSAAHPRDLHEDAAAQEFPINFRKRPPMWCSSLAAALRPSRRISKATPQA